MYYDGKFSNPIRITEHEMNEYVETFVVYLHNYEELGTAYSDVKISYAKRIESFVPAEKDEDGEIIKEAERNILGYSNHDITLEKDPDVILEEIKLDTQAISSNAEFTTSVTITNDSLETINELHAELSYEGTVVSENTIAKVVRPGETVTVDFTFVLNEIEKDYIEYSCKHSFSLFIRFAVWLWGHGTRAATNGQYYATLFLR